VSLKIPKLGGLRNTLAAARLLRGRSHQISFLVHRRQPAPRSQGLHFACAMPGIDYACELGEFDRLLDDPFEGLE